MRHERCSDDESDSYPRIGYQHFIDSSRACLALPSGICLAAPCSVAEGCPIGARIASPERSLRTMSSGNLLLLELGLHADSPNEAGQLTCDGHAGLVDLYPTLS